VGTWEANDPAYARPIAAPLERCAELLGVDLAAITEAATHVQPYVRVDGTKVWSLMQLERKLRPQAYGRVRGGYLARRRVRATDTWMALLSLLLSAVHSSGSSSARGAPPDR
jgi:hypothetical protein